MVEKWTCHVCGQLRPDPKISVQKNYRVLPGTNQKVQENVRFCNDKAECRAAAPKVTFMGGARKPVTATRRTRPIGE